MVADDWPEVPGLVWLGLLGRGGMGEVMLAEDVALGRRVAVKWVGSSTGDGGESLDGVERERFAREARVLAGLSHPHLVQVHRLGEAEGRLFMVLELVDGGSLSERLRERGALPLPEALEIVRQTLHGLGAVWSQGIVHRDVKPSNLLFDDRGRVKVADFGLALPSAAEDGRLTRTGMIVGSPHYMSPEQIRGEILDFRSDLYSLGVVLFEMLSGVPPFDGRTQGAILAGHLSEPLPDVRERCPALPEQTALLIERLTAKDPAARPASAAEVLAELGEAGDAPTVAASRPRIPPPLQETARRSALIADRSAGTSTAARRGSQDSPASGGWLRTRWRVVGGALVAAVLVGGALTVLLGSSRDSPRARQPRPRAETEALSESVPALPGLEITATAAPAPLPVGAEQPAAVLARELEERVPSGPADGESAIDPLEPASRGVRIRLAVRGCPVLFHLRRDGSVELLYPAPREASRPIVPDGAHWLPGPSQERGGWLVLAATARPLAPPALLGARPARGRTLYPATIDGATGTIYPAYRLLAWLVDNLGSDSGPWGMAVRPLGPGAEDPPDSTHEEERP